MNSRATRSKQAGFTLIELILALALAAGVLTAALVGGLSVWESCKANSEAQTIGYVVTGVQRLLPGNTNSDYSASGINEIALVNADRLPETMVVRSGGIAVGVVSAFGTPITIAPAPSSVRGVNVKYVSLPSKNCIDLVPLVANATQSVTIGANTVKVAGQPLNAPAASAACAVAPTVDVTFNVL